MMREVIEILRSSAAERGIDRIESVHMTVGCMSCAFSPALEAAFAALSEGDPLLGEASLNVEEEDIVIQCEACGKETELGDHEFACGDCRSTAVRVVRGNELIVDSYRGR